MVDWLEHTPLAVMPAFVPLQGLKVVFSDQLSLPKPQRASAAGGGAGGGAGAGAGAGAGSGASDRAAAPRGAAAVVAHAAMPEAPSATSPSDACKMSKAPTPNAAQVDAVAQLKLASATTRNDVAAMRALLQVLLHRRH